MLKVKGLASTNQQLIAEIMKWITQSGYQFNSMTQSNNDFILEFQETKTLPELKIIHQKKDDAYLLIVGLVRIPEGDRSTLKGQLGDQFSRFIWDIKIDLLRMGVDFTVLGPDDRDPEAWEVQTRLFINEGNATMFHEACTKIKHALISIIWTYKRALEL